MIIRVMKMEDYQGIYDLWMSCKGMGLNNLDDSEEGMRVFLECNPTTCIVAEDEGRIVGSIMVGTDGRRANIYHTCVAPDRRGEGIGSAITNAAMDAAHDMGIHKACLVAFARNEVGNAFWAKQGFYDRPDLTYRNKELDEIIYTET